MRFFHRANDHVCTFVVKCDNLLKLLSGFCPVLRCTPCSRNVFLGIVRSNLILWFCEKWHCQSCCQNNIWQCCRSVTERCARMLSPNTIILDSNTGSRQIIPCATLHDTMLVLDVAGFTSIHMFHFVPVEDSSKRKTEEGG